MPPCSTTGHVLKFQETSRAIGYTCCMDEVKYWEPPIDTECYSLPELESIADSSLPYKQRSTGMYVGDLRG
jgi:hypothetical protein